MFKYFKKYPTNSSNNVISSEIKKFVSFVTNPKLVLYSCPNFLNLYSDFRVLFSVLYYFDIENHLVFKEYYCFIAAYG